MVSHVKKPGVGPSQNPKATRKTSKPKPNAKPRTRTRARTGTCMHCRQRRVMCNGFQQTCIGCAKDVVLELQPHCMAVDRGMGNAQEENPVSAQIWTADPMQIDSGSGSNDNGNAQVPRSTPNPPSTLAIAPEMGEGPRNAAGAPASAQENTVPFAFRGQPWTAAPSPSFLSGITPWTPMDSSTFTNRQPFMVHPEMVSCEVLMPSEANTNPPANLSQAANVSPAANLNHTSRGRRVNNPSDLHGVAPSTVSTTPTVLRTPEEQAPMDFSSRMPRQTFMTSRAPVVSPTLEAFPESLSSQRMTGPAALNSLSTIDPSAIMESSTSMPFSAPRHPPGTIAPCDLMTLDEPQALRGAIESQAPANPHSVINQQPRINQQAVVRPPAMTTMTPPKSRGPSASTASPAIQSAPTARDPTFYMNPQIHVPMGPTMGNPSVATQYPAPMIPFTFQRPATAKPAKPRSKKASSRPAASRPVGGPGTRSKASASSPTQAAPNPPAMLMNHSVYRHPPLSEGPSVVTVLPAHKGSAKPRQLPIILVSAPPERSGPFLDLFTDADSPSAGYDTRYLHPPPIVTFPPNTALPKPLGSTALGPLAAKLSSVLRLEVAARQSKARPANAAEYLRIIQSESFCDEKRPKGAPNQLNPKLKSAMLDMEQLVTSPPPSSSSSSFSSTPFFLIPPRSLCLQLLTIYRHEVYFMFPFFNMHLFEEALGRLFTVCPSPGVASAGFGLGSPKEADGTTPLFQCALFVMLCHGVYYLDLGQEDKAFLSRVFWKCAKRFMTPELLKRSSLAAVQTFLIIAVAINSSILPGVQSRIPAMLASRIARSLGIDSGHDQTSIAAASPLNDINRQAWYGCVMMSLFSETPKSNSALNSNMIVAPLGTNSQSASPLGSVDFSFFTNCVVHIEQLEKILANIRRAREPILKTGPRDGYNSFNDIVPELLKNLGDFIATLPGEPQWGVSDLPRERGYRGGSESQKTFSNARFMHLRAMLFRPILMQMGLNDCLASDILADNVDPRVKDKTLMCAISCVDTAVNLILHLHQKYLLDMKSNREWWWDPYHTSTAGLILVMSQTSETLWASIQVGEVLRAWTACQDMLGHGATNNHFHRDALSYLWDLNSSISGCGVLKNDYDAMPRIKGPEPVTWSFYRTPYNQFLNPCSPFLNANMVQHQSMPPSKAFPMPWKPRPSTGPTGYAAPTGLDTVSSAGPVTDMNTEPLRPKVVPSTSSPSCATVVYPASTNRESNATPPAGPGPVPYTAAAAAAAVAAAAASAAASASSSLFTSLNKGTAPLMASLGFPSHAVAPGPTAYPASTGPASDPVRMSSSPGMIPYTFPGTATLHGVASSELDTIQHPSPSNPGFIPHDSASSPNTAPYSPVSGFPTIPFVDPLIASFDHDPSPYGVSLDPGSVFYEDFPVCHQAAINIFPSPSGMMPNLPPWEPNLANAASFGQPVDLGLMSVDAQNVYQYDASMGGFPGYFNPGDDRPGTINWAG